MWVDPDVRGSGVGETLIDTVIDRAASVAAPRVMLAVRRGNRHAIKLDERVGFVWVGVHPDDVDEDLMGRENPCHTSGPGRATNR